MIMNCIGWSNLCFFLFKQKTAYEMRISDWSSDVCSSDLMLALGGVRHLTGGSKKEGNVTCQMMLDLCNKQAVELAIDGGAAIQVQAGDRKSTRLNSSH